MRKPRYSEGFDPPPPKWVYEPVPDFTMSKHPKLDEDKYWEEQNRRWIEGHAGLTGAHYFYLQECFLNDIDGNVFRPMWRDVDELMFKWVDECMDSGQSLLVYKRREVGATSVFANLPYWFMKVYPGCRIGLTSGKGNDGINGMFNDKILFSYNRFNPIVFNSKPVQMNNTKNVTSLEVSLKVWNDNLSAEELRTSVLFCKETSEKPDSPTNLSGRRYKYVYVDEGPLHTRVEDFLGSIFPAISKGVDRTGLLVIAGTVEPKLTPQQVAAFYDLIERSKNLNVRSEMVPVWMGLITKNGWSDEVAGMDWYWENYKKFEESGDLKGLRDFKMQYPKDEQDIFDLSQGGFFEPDVADLLGHTYKKLLTERSEEVAYKLVNTPTGVEAMPDGVKRMKEKDGGHWIIEMPKKGVMYYQAIDGIGTGRKEGGEKGSWIGCIIFKGWDPDGGSFMPVAVYFERPNTIEDGYRQMMHQWNFYNKFGGGKEINYEVNASTGDHFGTFLEKNGLYQYAYKRKDLSGKGYINTKKRGSAINEHTRDWQVRQANMFLRAHGHNIKSRLLLESLLLGENENADLRDAFLIFMISIPNFEKPVERKVQEKFRSKVILERKPDGTFGYKTIKQKIGANVLDDMSRGDYVDHLKKKYGHYWFQKATGSEKEKLKGYES